MSDHDDDLIREALRAEAAGVSASDDLLERVRAEVRRPPLWRRRAPWLLAAAALVLLAGVAGALLLDGDDGDQRIDAVDDPAGPPEPGDVVDVQDIDVLPTTCPEPGIALVALYLDGGMTEMEVKAAEVQLRDDERVLELERLDQAEVREGHLERHRGGDVPAPDAFPHAFVVTLSADDDLDFRGGLDHIDGLVGTVSLRCDDTSPTSTGGQTERPSLVALVREDGWLVTVDLETGEARELHFYADPAVEDEVGMTYFIDGVDLSPDGEWIYFSTCCEPAVGTTYRIPVAGGEPEQVAQGAYPRVSPDGRYLAVGAGFLVTVFDLQESDTSSFEVVSSAAGHVAWSPDGSQVAFVDGGGPDETPQIRLLDWDGESLTEAEMGKPDNPGWFASWRPDGTLNVVSGEPIADDRYLSQDTSYQWLLWVDEAGVVREQAGFESGDRTPIEGLPRALAADW